MYIILQCIFKSNFKQFRLYDINLRITILMESKHNYLNFRLLFSLKNKLIFQTSKYIYIYKYIYIRYHNISLKLPKESINFELTFSTVVNFQRQLIFNALSRLRTFGIVQKGCLLLLKKKMKNIWNWIMTKSKFLKKLRVKMKWNLSHSLFCITTDHICTNSNCKL